MYFRSLLRLKLCSSVLICCSTLCIGLAVSVGYIINYVIMSGIEQELVLTLDNSNTWGEVPGLYNVMVYRNITVFEFLNPEDIYTPGVPLKFQMTEPVYLQEIQSINTPSFSSDNNLVNYTQNISFTVAMNETDYNRIMTKPRTIANFYAMGVWQGTKDMNQTQRVFYTLGQIVTTLNTEDDLYYEILTYTVFSLYVSKTSLNDIYAQNFQPCGVSQAAFSLIYNDPIYGLSNNQTLKIWVRAIDKGADSKDMNTITDYFDLNYEQVKSLMKLDLAKSVSDNVGLVKATYQCPGLTCSSTYLEAIQLGRQGVSLYPPPSVNRGLLGPCLLRHGA